MIPRRTILLRAAQGQYHYIFIISVIYDTIHNLQVVFQLAFVVSFSEWHKYNVLGVERWNKGQKCFARARPRCKVAPLQSNDVRFAWFVAPQKCCNGVLNNLSKLMHPLVPLCSSCGGIWLNTPRA